MFTGLVEHVGTLSYRSGSDVLTIGIQGIEYPDVRIGDSIACNGVCLTLTEKTARDYRFELMRETANKTLFPMMTIGSPVNVERSLRADARLDGHFVQGHVDTIGSVHSICKEQETFELHITVDAAWAPFFVAKGSVALNGVSLTIIDVWETRFSVGIIPHTYAHTSLGSLRVGDGVHCEFDIIGKYIERWLSLRENASKQSLSEVLKEW